MTEQEYVKIFEDIENNIINKQGGGGLELACIARLIFYTGIKASKIPELKVYQIVDENNSIRNTIEGSSVNIPAEVQRYLDKYHKERKMHVGRRGRFFTKYAEYTIIYRHLKDGFEIKARELHKSGIKSLYKNIHDQFLLQHPMNDEATKAKALQVTARRFCITEREVAFVIHDRIPGAGTPKSGRDQEKFVELIEKLYKENLVTLNGTSDEYKIKVKSLLQYFQGNAKYSKMLDDYCKTRNTNLKKLKELLP